MPPQMSPDHPAQEPEATAGHLNVRSEVIGGEEAAELGVTDQRITSLATLILGLFMLLASMVVLIQAVRLDNGSSIVGPATFPWVIGAGLLLAGVSLAIDGKRDLSYWQAHPRTGAQDWKRLGWMLAAVVIFALVVPFLGYVVASALLFAATAIVLGAPNKAAACAYGFITAALVWLLFDVAIGISLPAGPWGF